MAIDYSNTESYLGKTKSCYIGYANDESVRKYAASGGFVSSFLIYLLDKRLIDGAYVSKTYIENGTIKAYSYIAKTKQEILDSRTSIYMDFPYLKNLMELKNQDIKIAVVGLPCHIRTIEKMEKRFDWLKERIVFKIGMFCSHSSSPELIHQVVNKEGINLDDVDKFYFRRGHWRGFLTFDMKNGEKIQIPYLNFGLYMNLYFYERMRCLSCNDHTGSYSDISCGDAWLKRLKKHPIKHSMIIIRNQRAQQLFDEFCEEGIFHAEKIAPELIIKTQKRGLIRKKHYIYAYKKLAPIFNLKVSYNGGNYSMWNHYIGAFLLMLNIKISKNEKLMDLIFKIPKPFLYFYVALVKFFMNF